MWRTAGSRHVAIRPIQAARACRYNSRRATRTAPPPESPPEQPFAKSRALPWVLSSILGGAMAFYGAQLFVAARQPCLNPAVKHLEAQKDVSGRYEYTADSFDSEVGLSERLMGVNGIRKKLAAKATGHTLEVSCGTGRMLGYFDLSKNSSIESLTFVDLAPQMVEVCKKKWAAFGSNKDKLKSGLVVRFLAGSALGEMPLAPSPTPKKYDTILQTMGLCSTPHPVELLTNMARYLDTNNPDARILLLEHGRSYQEWLNNIIDSSAEKHAEIHGCWANRDIGALVEDAARKAGLEIVSERRHHLGTTWVFELKPAASAVKEAQAAEAQTDAKKSSKWSSWFG